MSSHNQLGNIPSDAIATKAPRNEVILRHLNRLQDLRNRIEGLAGNLGAINEVAEVALKEDGNKKHNLSLVSVLNQLEYVGDDYIDRINLVITEIEDSLL